MSSPMASSYWCYSCSRSVSVWSHDSVACPDCDGGFVEEIGGDSPRHEIAGDGSRRRFVNLTGSGRSSGPALRRSRRSSRERSAFNPVIVLRGSEGTERNGFELYYHDGPGLGLRPLPQSMSEFLLGSGFDRLLDQLSHIEINGIGRIEQPPASKAAIESMPIVEIVEDHVVVESHCAVCKEAFGIGLEAREMPCKHIYHEECILPWLAIRNSCPVCRHELPADVNVGNVEAEGLENGQSMNEEEAVGLTIWRLPGGGFAVGRFSGGRRGGERELPVVYTEMDGGFNSGVPMRVSRASGRSRRREGGGFGRMFRNLFGCFGGVQSSASSSSSDSRIQSTLSLFNASSSARRRRTSWHMEDDSGMRRW